MPFSKLQLHSRIVKHLNVLGYKAPTPVQNKVIPKILKGCDLRVSSPTGTGKTAAFLLPSLTHLMQPSDKGKKGPRILILVPTRELAIQVASQAEKYSKTLNRIKTVCIYGGMPYHRQNRELSKPHEIIVATPGRFIDLLDQRRISLSRIEIFILDEADRMLDMGFSEPVNQIANQIKTKHQTLLFSATLKGNVLDLSNKLLTKPLEINVAFDKENKENIEQRLHYVDNINHKYKILQHLLKDETIDQSIVFTSTKHQADKLCESLFNDGYLVDALHGDMNQRQRTKTIMSFRKKRIKILIATDVASRGIDVMTITHVINFDFPTDKEDYIHRIGRTGRAGQTGLALSFATLRERSLVLAIEKLIGKKIKCDVIPGLEPQKKLSQIKDPRKKNYRNNKNKRSFSNNNKSFKNKKRLKF